MTNQMRDAQTLPLLSSTDLSLDLERQRRFAKELRNAVREGCKTSIDRLKVHHPRFDQLELSSLKLSDAQLTLAREAGLPSWPALKKHVQQMDIAKTAIEQASTAPDADLPTLHIRCGNDIETALKRAGFAGDFLMFADPICQGPVKSGKEAQKVRAEFIASEYPGEIFEETLEVLKSADTLLSNAGNHGRIVLWFEHDPYDQLLLARCLAVLRQTGADRRKVELVSLDRFPGIEKFIGIGQLSPAALRYTYDQRQPVSASAYATASDTWNALSAPSPLPLFEIASQSKSLPYLSGSILRYLAELPSVENGLSFTEHTILDILKDGPLSWAGIFREFLMKRDPLPYHGDLMFLGTLLRLRDAGQPALTSETVSLDQDDWGKAEFALTEAGELLLQGKADWKDFSPRKRQHGGIDCFGNPDWRWDKVRRCPVAAGTATSGNSS
ncbi:DUF1835 domain-containing protein [Roseibium sp. SCP14]|uniref:DUF1835 domain-containing protein n=1 Tax=Roseibium sp. SCP14 TaxID=3141375 RepID=UPI00333C3AFB